MFRKNARVVQAATVPFFSLKPGVGTPDAVQTLLLALYNIQAHSDSLSPQYKPRTGDTGRWLVFFAEDEYPKGEYGRWTEFSVKAFQTQSKRMQADGKAGIETLPFLDEIVYYLESIGLIDSEPDLT